ncbi:MAG: hypothetical protein LGB69_07660 [Sulfurovum sp.]|nr:hypothetical protein [Sulfurovum sp.]
MWIAIIFVTDCFYVWIEILIPFFSILKKGEEKREDQGQFQLVRATQGQKGMGWYGQNVRAQYQLVRAMGEGTGWYGLVKQNGMEPVQANWYGGSTDYGAGAVRGPHISPCAAHTVKYMGPLRVTVPPIVGSVGTARTMPSLCPYQPHTGMFAAVDMMVQILLKPVQILLKPILFFSYIHVLAW